MSETLQGRFMEMEERHASGVYRKRELVLVRGEGALLWDEAGREYIDCVGGQGSANLGHCNPYIQRAVANQMERLGICTELFYNDVRAAYLEKLTALTPPGLDRVFLCNSGTESVEGALKFAHLATGRPLVLGTRRGFHGKSLGSQAATWNPEHRELFAALISPAARHVPYNDLEAMDEAITDQVAAVILEVVQGEGGVYPGDGEYLRGVEALCRDRGAMFVIDEVQTGFGRTGKLFAFEHYGLTPDILCLAKSIAGGLPMGAIVLGPRIQNIKVGVHSTTFGGNPVCMAAANAALEFIEEDGLVAKAAARGAQLMEGLAAMDCRLISEVRGMGLLVGVELRRRAGSYAEALMEEGVLVLLAGPRVLRFLPPLVITEEQVKKVLAAVERVLA